MIVLERWGAGVGVFGVWGIVFGIWGGDNIEQVLCLRTADRS